MSAEKEAFAIDPDGWVHLTPFGEFPHRTGVVQVIDRRAADAIKKSFDAKKDAEGDLFAGVLLDYDHFSMDTDKPSEAAGWIVGMEVRDDGLWGKVRWTDTGLKAVTGGRYRFVSLVFPPAAEFEEVEAGTGRKRPLSVVSCALTNEPNIKGGRPLANRQVISNREKVIGEEASLAGGGAKRYRWVLGSPPSGEHCGECLARAGKVKTGPEWAAMGMPPCNCHCSLEEVDDDTANRWSNVARAASLAVRQAKAAARNKAERETGDVSRGGAETQRKLAARAAVMRELAEKRSTLK